MLVISNNVQDYIDHKHQIARIIDMRRESERIGYGIEFEMIYRALVSNCFDRK